MDSYKELKVWKRSFSLVTKLYLILKAMPKDETFGLTSQLKRCAVSIPSNIAEGFGRQSQKSFAQYLKISRGSLFELETQLLLVKEIKLLEIEDEIFKEINEIANMLNALIKRVQQNIKS